MTSKRSLWPLYRAMSGAAQAIFASDSQEFESVNRIKGLEGDPHILIRPVEGLIPRVDGLIQGWPGLTCGQAAKVKLHKLRVFGVAWARMLE